MSDRLRAGVIGVGLAGAAHIEAIGRTGLAQVVAVAAGRAQSARAAAARHGVPRVHEDWRALVEDESIDVVHNCTPNHLHVPVGLAALAHGKHLVCEKPLAVDLDSARGLVRAARDSDRVSVLCHNYRHYAMVARARELVGSGAIGAVHHVHGVYLQDGLSDASAANWRLDPAEGGTSITFADIGTHWCDLAVHLLGHRIEALCAATGGLHGRAGDDHAAALLTFEGGALGTVVASQVSPGTKNGLRIHLDGSDGSIHWDQEQPEELWVGRADRPAELHRKTSAELGARSLAHLPAGHTEGWNSTFVNLFSAVYRRILGVEEPGDEQVATFTDGLALMAIVEAVQRSARERSWVSIEPVASASG